jgi:hypothetical protein
MGQVEFDNFKLRIKDWMDLNQDEYDFFEEIDSLKVEYKKDSIYIHYWETNYDNQVVKSEIKISQ